MQYRLSLEIYRSCTSGDRETGIGKEGRRGGERKEKKKKAQGTVEFLRCERLSIFNEKEINREGRSLKRETRKIEKVLRQRNSEARIPFLILQKANFVFFDMNYITIFNISFLYIFFIYFPASLKKKGIGS